METQNKTLQEYMYDLGVDPLTLKNDQFTQWVKEIPQNIRLELISNLRDHKEFYKKILEEKYRNTHPNSVRYADAERKISVANEKGKILKSIIDNH